MMYGIEYNGLTEKDIGIVVTKRPAVPSAKEKYQAYSIQGADGEAYEFDGSVEDIKIEISLGFRSEPDTWMESYRKIKRWLSGCGKLILSDDPDYFYKVKLIDLGKTKRNLRKLGEITATFVCEGYQYLLSGVREYQKENVLYNPYEECRPVYKIIGEGLCVLNVNGNTMTATVGQNLTINTELMLAYREDGTMMNTAVSGDYEDLHLQTGTNEISITDGFVLSVIPNWRCS